MQMPDTGEVIDTFTTTEKKSAERFEEIYSHLMGDLANVTVIESREEATAL